MLFLTIQHAYDMGLQDCAKDVLMNFQGIPFQVSEVPCGNLYAFLRIGALEISHDPEESRGSQGAEDSIRLTECYVDSIAPRCNTLTKKHLPLIADS
jgi:hypothetical protein